MDLELVRSAARGKWLSVLSAVGIPEESLILTGQRPCPKCGGTDRFHLFPNSLDTGSVRCRRCHDKGGDGFDTVQWWLGCDFKTAVARVAEVVHVPASSGVVANAPRTAEATTRSPTRMFATPGEAMAAVDKRLAESERVSEYAYHDLLGRPIAYELRYDRSRTDSEKPDKQFCPIHLGSQQQWCIGAPPKWPLYRLPEIASHDTVFLTEGAKAADAIWSIGLPATTSAGGASGLSRSDWSSLSKKRVIVLPDNDLPGKEYQKKATEILENLDPPSRVSVVQLPNVPPKGDAVEWLQTFGDSAEPDVIRNELLELVAVAEMELSPRPNPIAAADLVHRYPLENQEIIEGILRREEVGNLIAASKTHKSFFALQLALSIAAGRDWLGCRITKGRVLIVDNELRPETISSRLRSVAKAMGIDLSSLASSLVFEPLRGRVTDLVRMQEYFDYAEDDYDVIFLDALYRFMPANMNENSNGDVTQLYNVLNGIARRTSAAILVIHHASKGDQSRKAMLDVGSGAGAMARAADTQIVMRPHEMADMAVMEVTTRTFAPPQPRSLLWAYPTWEYKPMIPPELMQPPSAAEVRQAKRNREGFDKILAALAAARLEDSKLSESGIRRKTCMSLDRVRRLLGEMLDNGLVVRAGTEARQRQEVDVFTLPKQEDE